MISFAGQADIQVSLCWPHRSFGRHWRGIAVRQAFGDGSYKLYTWLADMQLQRLSLQVYGSAGYL